MIEWNDGLNLGVSSLDEEHKHLLKLINKLSLSITEDSTKEHVNAIFDELFQTMVEHSKNEEELLQKCDYKDLELHIKDHLDFIDQIRELKGNYNNSTSTEDIAAKLYDLLLMHIVLEDIPLISFFEEKGLIQEEKSEKYIFNKLIKKITDTISFTKRILLSALIPLSGMLILGFIILMGNYYKHEELKDTFSITKIISNVNSLAHALQIERGLSSGYLSSAENKFQSSLSKQHLSVDREIEAFNLKLSSINKKNLKTIQEYIQIFKTDISKLNSLRQRVDSKTITQMETMTLYTETIKNILDITSKIASFNINPKIHASISTLYSILQYKEALGQSRAYGTVIIEKDNTLLNEKTKFIQLLSTQNAFLELYDKTASSSQKKLKNSLLNSTLHKKIDSYEKKILENKFLHLDSEVWFKDMTLYINSVKNIENILLDETTLLLEAKLKEDVHHLILWIIYIGLIITITIFIIYLFERSSKNQLYQLTDAMNHLANGQRDMRLKPTQLKDALSQMYHAYEITRQKLLHGDVYAQLYKNQKDIEIIKQQKVNDKLEEIAFIDPLTNCVNRRKFEELSNQELQRSSRYNSELSFLMLDIDHFKAVNDTYGHAIGDDVLKHFSSVCLKLARDTDIVARIGGEEFIVMLPETNEDSALIFAERFREKIYNSTLTIDEHTIKYSVSIGISSLNSDNDSAVSVILQRADKALYEAKKSGRNKSIIFKEQI